MYISYMFWNKFSNAGDMKSATLNIPSFRASSLLISLGKKTIASKHWQVANDLWVHQIVQCKRKHLIFLNISSDVALEKK